MLLGWTLTHLREPIAIRLGLGLRPAPSVERTGPVRLPVAPGSCQPAVGLLRRTSLALTDEIFYSRRCIRPRWSPDVDVREVVKLDRPLLAGGRTHLNLTICEDVKPDPCDTISLEVPHPPPTNKKFPHLIFAVATTYDRLQNSLLVFEHWLSGSSSRLIAIVIDGGPPNDLAVLEALYSSHDIDLQAVLPRRPGLNSDKNHFALIEDLLAAADTRTHWLSIIDDDTFFPALPALSTTLSTYDHTVSTWLGALSEDRTAVERWGLQAFGGAGIFLSVPLARKLVPHIDSCLAAATVPNGDKILQDCITTHAPETNLTVVPGLWQLDIVGDGAGFYEAGRSRRLLSLHHWKSWHRAPVAKMAAVVRVCGDCFLQRWRFADGVLLVNGFSVTEYSPKGMLDKLDLQKMEATWQQAGEDFGDALGPLREKLGPERKKSWRLEEVAWGEDRGLRQIYVRRGSREKGEIDEVLEMVWEVNERDEDQRWAR